LNLGFDAPPIAAWYLTWTEDNLLRQVSYRDSGRKAD